MRRTSRTAIMVGVAIFLVALIEPTAVGTPPSGATTKPLGVTWMQGYRAPGTPARLDKVGVIKVGPSTAKNVLVLEPGTSAAAAYFVPLAKWIVARATGWQVWSVERRESLLEDQSALNLYKQRRITPTQLFDYYLGYLKDPSITHHFRSIPSSSVEFAKQWGMTVAIQDLRRVITTAHRLGGKVVLGGHSLGGSVVTAYATWDFGGHAGADGLAGLVYDDGGSFPVPTSAAQATSELATLNAPAASPWLSFGGIAAPFAGIFNATGSVTALLDPNGQSLGQSSGLLPTDIVPSVPVTNQAQYGYALNAATSPASLEAAQAHLGQGISNTTINGVHTWNGAGALTPISRFATMFSGYPMQNADGTEWYFPQRLTDDTGAVNNGIANPAQKVLDVDATMGKDLPRTLRILAICTVLGGTGVLTAAKDLAAQSHIPAANLTLINRQSSYSHNDPAGAFPNNAFYAALARYLHNLAS